MCSEICEIVENVQPGRVFVVEEGGIWFSGMNADLGTLVEEVAAALQEAGYEVEPPRDDGIHATEFGGLYLPVPDACSVDDETHNALVSAPGGDRGTPVSNP